MHASTARHSTTHHTTAAAVHSSKDGAHAENRECCQDANWLAVCVCVWSVASSSAGTMTAWVRWPQHRSKHTTPVQLHDYCGGGQDQIQLTALLTLLEKTTASTTSCGCCCCCTHMLSPRMTCKPRSAICTPDCSRRQQIYTHAQQAAAAAHECVAQQHCSCGRSCAGCALATALPGACILLLLLMMMMIMLTVVLNTISQQFSKITFVTWS